MDPDPPISHGRTAAIILVGGLGSRMTESGVAKPLLPVGSGALLDLVLARVSPQVATTCLGVHEPAAIWDRFGLDVVLDPPGSRQGPLAGILSGLHWAARRGYAFLLVAPGDTPFLPADLVIRLHPGPAVAATPARVHNLVCLLPVMSRPVLAGLLSNGHTRAGDFLEAVGARRVVFGDEAAFHNINTPQDLQEARSRLLPGAAAEAPP